MLNQIILNKIYADSRCSFKLFIVTKFIFAKRLHCLHLSLQSVYTA